MGLGKGNEKIVRTFEECVFQSSCGLMASLFPEHLLLTWLAFLRPWLHMAAVCCSSRSDFDLTPFSASMAAAKCLCFFSSPS